MNQNFGRPYPEDQAKAIMDEGELYRTGVGVGLGAPLPVSAPSMSSVYSNLGNASKMLADLCRRSRDLAERMTGSEPTPQLPDYARHDSIPGAHMAMVNEIQIMLGQLDGDMRRIERGLGLTEEF